MVVRRKRASGVLAHITSIPSDFGIGDLGPSSYRFAEILARSEQSYWQFLPLNPTSDEFGNSPYTSSSAYAGNELLISPQLLLSDGILDSESVMSSRIPPSDSINYAEVSRNKHLLLEKAFHSFQANFRNFDDFERFDSENSQWLDDYALFRTLRRASGQPWYLWPEGLRDRDKSIIDCKLKSLEGIKYEKFVQFVFFRQFRLLRDFCSSIGLDFIGDLPFYMSHDSADVWSSPEIFKLDSQKRPVFISGVPPDYFSKTGQLWSHPVYDWERLREEDFVWWTRRIEHNLRLFKTIRIDHFRGLLAYWEVPVSEDTAINGRWVRAPSEDFFKILQSRFPSLPFIAEDLGVITEDVRQAINVLKIPGMRVLVFAFDGDPNNSHLPTNHSERLVVYTGTHDTNTVRGWFNEEASHMKENIFRYVGRSFSEAEASWEFVKMASSSVADLCILPVQDVLSLGSQARMNNPALTRGNYVWRLDASELKPAPFASLMEVTKNNGRC